MMRYIRVHLKLSVAGGHQPRQTAVVSVSTDYFAELEGDNFKCTLTFSIVTSKE